MLCYIIYHNIILYYIIWYYAILYYIIFVLYVYCMCIVLYCFVFVYTYILCCKLYIYINGHLFCIFLCGCGHVIKVFINISIVKLTPMESIQRVASCAAPVLNKEDAAMFLKSWTCDLNLNLNLCPYTNSYSNIPIASAKNRNFSCMVMFW